MSVLRITMLKNYIKSICKEALLKLDFLPILFPHAHVYSSSNIPYGSYYYYYKPDYKPQLAKQDVINSRALPRNVAQ